MIKRIVSFDPSIESGHTGWAAWELEARWKVVAHDIISYPKGTSASQRLRALQVGAADIITVHKPDLVVKEGHYRRTGRARKNVSDKAVIQLAKAGGVLELLDVLFEDIPPGDWLGHFGLFKFTDNPLMMVAYANQRLKELGAGSTGNEHTACAVLIGLYWVEKGAKSACSD